MQRPRRHVPESEDRHDFVSFVTLLFVTILFPRAFVTLGALVFHSAEQEAVRVSS